MDMDFTQVGTDLAIGVICYLVGVGAKLLPAIPDEAIPVIVGISGGLLGIVGMFVIPDFPANDILNAIAVGIGSGLAATGANQVYKQATKIR